MQLLNKTGSECLPRGRFYSWLQFFKSYFFDFENTGICRQQRKIVDNCRSGYNCIR